MSVCDSSLEGHSARVGAYAEVVARRLGWTDATLGELHLGAVLHDVGKMNLRPGLLAKPRRLDEVELAEVRAHPVEGAWLIAGVPSLAAALPYVLFHHERWDGSGYPTRRAGYEIPPEGRLLAVVDAFDAMTSPRPYRDPMDLDGAVAEVERNAGTQFDPTVVAAFVEAHADGEIVAPEPLSIAV